MKYVAEEKITIFVHLKKIVPFSQFQVELIKLEAWLSPSHVCRLE